MKKDTTKCTDKNTLEIQYVRTDGVVFRKNSVRLNSYSFCPLEDWERQEQELRNKADHIRQVLDQHKMLKFGKVKK